MVLAALLLSVAAQAAPVDRGSGEAAADFQIEGDPLPVEDCGPQRAPTGERATGTVRFFSASKGFGFIARDDGLRDIFVHISQVEGAGMTSLNAGDRVEFEVATDQRGKNSAVDLVPIR